MKVKLIYTLLIFLLIFVGLSFSRAHSFKKEFRNKILLRVIDKSSAIEITPLSDVLCTIAQDGKLKFGVTTDSLGYAELIVPKQGRFKLECNRVDAYGCSIELPQLSSNDTVVLHLRINH